MTNIHSRRAILAGIAATPALAVPALAASATALVPETGWDVAAALCRLEQTIETLRTCVVCKGWHPNGLEEPAAARALAYFRAGCPEESDEDFAEREAAFDFIYGHGQSIDWIIFGDPGGLICRAAAHSRRAQSVLLGGPDPIFALIEAHRAALAAHLAAGKAQSDLEERLFDERMAAAGSPENGSAAWYEAIHAADRDPLYMDAEALVDKTSDAEIAAAWALVAEPPATIAGAAALAAYPPEYKSTMLLPDKPEEWLLALLASINSALSAEAVS